MESAHAGPRSPGAGGAAAKGAGPAGRGGGLRAWLPVAAWVAAILVFSGEEFSARQTSRILGPLLGWLFPGLDVAQLYALHMGVRKAAHVIEYALLGLLAFRAFRLSLAVSLPRAAGLGLALVLAVAATDELRQSMLRSRTGSLADVGFDFAGGALGVGLLVAAHRAAGIAAPRSAAPPG